MPLQQEVPVVIALGPMAEDVDASHIYVYIYIYRERERERENYINIGLEEICSSSDLLPAF